MHLEIFDSAGRLVRTLLDHQARPAGRTDVVWDGRNHTGARVASGVYLCRLDVKGQVLSQRMTLIK